MMPGVLTVRGGSSRPLYHTSQNKAPVKDARFPQNARAFWLPPPPRYAAPSVSLTADLLADPKRCSR